MAAAENRQNMESTRNAKGCNSENILKTKCFDLCSLGNLSVKLVHFQDNTAEKELEEQQEGVRVKKNVYNEYLHQKIKRKQ